jgi:hypothetical protein
VADLHVTCIRKRGSHYDPHERIEGIGGDGWYKTEATAISEIENGTNTFYVLVNGIRSNVVVATHNGRKYLKTTADGYEPNNLLALPECQ